MEAARTCYCSRCLTTFSADPEKCPNLGCKGRRPEGGWGTLLESGDVLDRHYRIEKRLAIGGAGVTYLARELSSTIGDDVAGPLLAVKVLYAQRDQGAYLRRLSTEAQILLELAHPHIVQIMGFVQRAGHSPYLVTRFEEGGSLLDHLRKVGSMSIPVVAAMGVQLADALAVAHQRGVIHRDLKPENILLSKPCAAGEVPQLRLTDFGIAKIYGGVGERLTRVGAFVGTPQYAAPEQFEGTAPTPAADVYSMAAVLLFCVQLRPLVPNIDPFQPEESIQKLEEKLPPIVDEKAGDAISVAGFNAFLAATMARQPGDRCDINEARQMLHAIAEGRAVRTHVPSVPDLPPVKEDTFAGILSRDAVKPAPSAPAAPAPAQPAAQPAAPPTPPPPQPLPTSTTQEVEPEPPPRSKGGMVAMLLAVLVLGCGGLGGAAIWWSRPVALNPNNPDHQVVLDGVQALVAAQRKACGPGRLQIEFTASREGKLSDVKVAAEQAKLGQCIAKGLDGKALRASPARPVRGKVALN